MPRYAVSVRYEQDKEIKVWARDEDTACEKAVEIVEGWHGVIAADANHADEIDE